MFPLSVPTQALRRADVEAWASNAFSASRSARSDALSPLGVVLVHQVCAERLLFARLSRRAGPGSFRGCAQLGRMCASPCVPKMSSTHGSYLRLGARPPPRRKNERAEGRLGGDHREEWKDDG